MPINTEEARAWIAEVLPDNRVLYGSEIPTAALMMQKASLQVQLEILDEMRAIRAAAVNPPRTVEPERTDRTPSEPTEDEIRLVQVLENGLVNSQDSIAIVRAIIDAIRPMTDRQWDTLPGLGKPWKDLSSGEVWQCFLESISPKVEPAPPPPPPEPLEWAKDGEPMCGKRPDPRFTSTCVLRQGHKGACDDGIQF